MKHPSRETWMAYLYDELNTADRTEAGAHLAGCPECQNEVRAWRTTLSALSSWKLPRRRTQPGVVLRPLVSWAAAAVVVVSIGFGLGRASAPVANVEQIRAALEPALREQLRADLAQTVRAEVTQASANTLNASREETRQLLAGYAEQVAAQRGQDWERIGSALTALRLERLKDRRDLETVAVNAGAGLQQTRQQLAQLADYSNPTPGNF